MAKALQELIKENWPDLNILANRSCAADVQKRLQDEFLWIRHKHVSAKAEESLTNLGKLTKAKGDESIFRKRRELVFSPQAIHEKKIHHQSKKLTKDEVKEILFSDPFTRFPSLLSEAAVSEANKQVLDPEANQKVSLGTLQGVVTDLYQCPEGNQWEGFAWSFFNPDRMKKEHSLPATFKFTEASCNCVFPVCLGAIVEFHPSTTDPLCVADCSLKVLHYFPDSLPIEYATKFIQQLESMVPLDRVRRIFELPGPFAALMDDAKLYRTHQSTILAVLSSILNDEDGSFPTALYTFHTSHFIQELPQILADQNITQCRDVHFYLHLVAKCVWSFPAVAYELGLVIQSCMKLASSVRSEFADEVSNLSQAVINACSVVRREALVPPDDTAPIQETAEESISSEKKLLDPLLWVRCFFGQTVAQSLSKFLSQKCLFEGTEVVATRKRIESSIIQSLESRAAKQKEKQEEEKANLPIVKKTTISCTHDPSLSIKEGIIIDLYQDGKGYVALAPSPVYLSRVMNKCQVFTINHDSKVTTANEITIHVGDVVAFQVSPDSPGMVYNIVKVVRYCPEALDEEFALATLSSRREYHSIEGFFENEEAIKAIFNAPEVYKNAKVYGKVLDVAMACFSDSYSTSSTRKKMLNLLKSSSFICDLIEIAPQEVSQSVVILQEYLQEFPNEVCTLVPALNATVARLLEQNTLPNLANFISFLSTSPCILPPEIELLKQPWQSIPLILTKEELVSGSIANKAYLPVVKDRGSYNSVNEYGRTYFILLRADCHGELAAVISRLRDSNAPASTKRESEPEVPVYDVSFEGLSNRGTGQHLVYRFNVETRPCKVATAEMSPNDLPLLKAGNLLCFSVGGRFEDDIIWATINHVNGYVDSKDTPEGRVKSVSPESSILNYYGQVLCNSTCTCTCRHDFHDVLISVV